MLIISLLSCQMYNLSSFHTSFPLVVFLTRLFSFHPLNFDSSICHLQNALQQISSWMTANLVTLNSSKTECLHIGHIGLKTNLSKHNSSVDTPTRLHLWRTTYSVQITSLSKACYYHIRQLRFFPALLDLSTACTIATSIVHSKLDYCNSLYDKRLKSPLSHLQVIQNSVACTVVKSPVISLPPYTLCTGSGSLNASNTSSSHLPTKFSQLPNLHTFITSSAFNVLAVLSSSVVILAQPASSSSLKLTDRSFCYVSPCLCNQLPLSLRQPHSGTSSSISESTVSSPITSSSSDSSLSLSITPCVFPSQLKTYLFLKSYPL